MRNLKEEEKRKIVNLVIQGEAKNVKRIYAAPEVKEGLVEILGEKNGWLYLSAKGFTFSSPTINVKLSQEKVVVVPTPTPTPSAVASVAPVAKKSVTITCAKGKTTKKVSGESPKCPTGYKKK